MLRVVLGVVSVSVMCSVFSVSQDAQSSLGPRIETSLGYSPSSAALVNMDRQQAIAVLLHGGKGVRTYALSDLARNTFGGSLSTRGAASSLKNTDLDADGRQELLLLSPETASLSVFRQGKPEITLIAETGWQTVCAGDVNNDKRTDLLLYGKTASGVALCLGRQGGGFQKTGVLFSEISVSDLKVTELNGDRIADIFLIDWLSNTLVLLYGIGRGIFSEQIAVDLQGEPGQIAVSAVSKSRTVQVAVTLPETDEIRILTLNSAGELISNTSLRCPGQPAGVDFADFNKDGRWDVVSAAGTGLLVFLGTSTSEFGPGTFFDAGGTVSSWQIADIDADGWEDVFALDVPNERLLVYGNARPANPSVWPHEYAVGAMPQGLAVDDFNADGLWDVAVVNTSSSSLSILLNKGNGRLDGQQSISVSDHPSFVRTIRSNHTSVYRAVTVHPSEEKLTVVSLSHEISKSASAVIPTGPNPSLVSVQDDTATGHLTFLIRNISDRDGSISLSRFEQIGQRQFIETSLRARIPGSITALTADDFNADSKNDLVFATHDKPLKQSSLSLLLDGEAALGPPTKLFSFTDSIGTVRSVVTALMNNDTHKDILLTLASPTGALVIAYGQGNGTFRDSLEWIPGVRPVNDDSVLLQDLNGDHFNDIAVIDAERQSVLALFGAKGGKFGRPFSIYPSKGVVSMRVAPLKNAGVLDLILSHSDRGTVSVVFHPFEE